MLFCIRARYEANGSYFISLKVSLSSWFNIELYIFFLTQKKCIGGNGIPRVSEIQVNKLATHLLID